MLTGDGCRLRCASQRWPPAVTWTKSDAWKRVLSANPARSSRTEFEPAIAWKTVVLNRRRILCAFCFDVEAEKPGVANTFTDLEAQSWSGRPTPLNSYKRKR